MTLATKSGGLILKDGRIATNCACCGEQACGCGLASQVRPESLIVEFLNFNFSPQDSIFNVPGEAQGQDQAATSYVAGLGQIPLGLYSHPLVGGPSIAGFEYGNIGCSSSAIGSNVSNAFTDIACPCDFYANAPIVIGGVSGNVPYTVPSLRCSLTCGGLLQRRSRQDIHPPGFSEERWQFWRPLSWTGFNYAASPCGNMQEWEFSVRFFTGLVAPFTGFQVTPLCEQWSDPVEFFARIGLFARARITDNSVQVYLADGTVRVTPSYGNPLP